jgi:hypothetical protein
LQKRQQYFEMAHEFVGPFESEGVAITGIGLIFVVAQKKTQDEKKEHQARHTNGNHCQCNSRTPRTRYTFTVSNAHVIWCTHQTEGSSIPQKTLGISGSMGNVQLDACFFRTTSFFGNRIGVKTTMAFVAGGENWARCGRSPMAGQSSHLGKQDAVFERTIGAQ